MAQQELHVELACALLDRPGGERVTKPVRVHLGEAGPPAEAAQELLDAVGPQLHAGAQLAVPVARAEERARRPTAAAQVVEQHLPARRREGHDALLVPLRVEDAQPLPREVEVVERELRQLRDAQPRVEQREDDVARSRRPAALAGQAASSACTSPGAKGPTICRGSRTFRRWAKGVVVIWPVAASQLKKQRTSRK